MSDSEKPRADLADSSAVTRDEDGRLREIMERLSKHSGGGKNATESDT